MRYLKDIKLYLTSHQMNHGVTLDVLPRNSYYPDIEMGCDIQDDTSIEGVRCVWVRK